MLGDGAKEMGKIWVLSLGGLVGKARQGVLVCSVKGSQSRVHSSSKGISPVMLVPWHRASEP